MFFVFVAVALLCCLPAAALIGYRLGRYQRARRPDVEVSHELPNALLALAGLLIGFTFAMAQQRYDARKQIVLAEASAIKLTYERTRLLDDVRGEPLRALLRRYVDARMAFARSGLDWTRVETTQRQSNELAEEIWLRVSAAGRADLHSVMISQLVQSTGQMIEAADDHMATLANPLPNTVFVVLGLVAAVALAAVGYVAGLKRKVTWLGMVVMPLLLAVVILLVFVISYPRMGIVQVRDPILPMLRQSF